jgi:hypothetical protein
MKVRTRTRKRIKNNNYACCINMITEEYAHGLYITRHLLLASTSTNDDGEHNEKIDLFLGLVAYLNRIHWIVEFADSYI